MNNLYKVAVIGCSLICALSSESSDTSRQEKISKLSILVNTSSSQKIVNIKESDIGDRTSSKKNTAATLKSPTYSVQDEDIFPTLYTPGTEECSTHGRWVAQLESIPEDESETRAPRKNTLQNDPRSGLGSYEDWQ